MRGLTVAELVAQLEEFPGHWPVAIETIVGGDIGTDDVDVHNVRAAGFTSAYVLLVPEADRHNTQALIDEALAARAQEAKS